MAVRSKFLGCGARN